MSETQPKEQPSRVVVPMTVNDLIYMQLQDFKTEFRDSRKELNARMDKQDARMDRIEARIDKLDARIDKLEAKIDKLSDKIDSSMNQGQICLITTVGIALTVIYSVFLK